ncbi:NADH dehydrogenase [ubiquinone] 1 alpha subcomplex assembly factor 3 [Octopus sinensis]|uniref:NADH dehydrogenase [ubiquinone] 1 alpha subcomplex assembly factor 3 n=1 Tax=Octopus sinensis TaxID=2607531 RepID=A0A6P7SY12_9MOLL|nr:NADH dehydrogenase [ubiquinone] 1 alpha subcomplex assembly factor 3 [Octopus sinensis]
MYRHYLATPLRRAFNVAFRQQVRFFDDEFAYAPSSISMLNKEEDSGIMVEAYSPYGFKLNNNIRIFGPCALFPRSILHWNVQGPEDISEDSLSLFCLLAPKPDILLLGVGSDTSKFDKRLIRYLRSKNISFEILTTDHACSTFNFLNAERRFVAAGLIPPNFESDESQGVAVKIGGLSNSAFMFQTGIFEAPKEPEKVKNITKELLGEDNEKLWDVFQKKYLKRHDSIKEESEKHDEKEYLKKDPLNQDKTEDEKK